MGHRHVCSTCETETEIKTEEDIPVGDLSHDDSMQSITYTIWELGIDDGVEGVGPGWRLGAGDMFSLNIYTF